MSRRGRARHHLPRHSRRRDWLDLPLSGRVAHVATRYRLVVVLCAAVLCAVAGVLGAGVVPSLQALGFTDPSAESTTAGAELARVFHTADPGLVIVVTARSGNVDSPEVSSQGQRLTATLRAGPGVSLVQSYWDTRSPLLVSRSRTEGLLLAVMSGDEAQRTATVNRLQRSLSSSSVVATVIGGPQVGNMQATTRTVSDLRRTEMIAVPLTLVLLVLAFGGIVAATLPLVVGGVAVVGTLCALRGLAQVTDVSVYALNLTTALGLGLGIDYALFIVSRYRDERRGGRDVETALAVTLETAGRTVLFSAGTVGASLSALLLFPQYLLRSFGYAGIAVVAIACLAALIILPAVLALADGVLNRWALPFSPSSMTSAGPWLRSLTRLVLRQPAPVAAAVLVVLGALCLPAASVAFGLPDDRVLPPSASSRQVGDVLRRDFPVEVTAPVNVILRDVPEVSAGCDRGSYQRTVSRLPGVAQVQSDVGTDVDGNLAPPNQETGPPFRVGSATRLQLLLSGDPYSRTATAVVQRLRQGRPGCALEVTGLTAQGLDTVQSIRSRLPLALTLVGGATLFALLLMTGSLIIPIKAVLLSAISLGSTFGIAVWIFQHGALSGLLGFTPTGWLDVSVMLLVSCLCFGLSMDYEVFIISRIVEDHDRGADTATAVGHGLERTGRILTTAAALLGVVFVAVASSDIGLLKLLGWTTAVAILLDATLIRALLLPALMRLMGSFNWWAPAPLSRHLSRHRIAAHLGQSPLPLDRVLTGAQPTRPADHSSQQPEENGIAAHSDEDRPRRS